MQEQITKKKKKKKKKLMISVNQLPREKIEATEKEIRERLKKTFKFHIGKENSISPAEIMLEVFKISDEQFSNWHPYKISFWWEVVKKVLRGMRREMELFVINRGGKYFVLSNEEESKYYKDMLTRDIKNMKESMKRADKWVAEKMYSDF